MTNTIGKAIKAALALSAIAPLAVLQAERPNIVYIFTDQHTATALSCAGNKDLHTPNIDKLAKMGIRFTNAYCASPLSTPSRAAMFTGLTPSVTQQTVNGSSIPADIIPQTVGRLLQSAGYDCGYAGKWHIPTADIPDQIFGFTHLFPHNDNGLSEACINFIKQKRSNPYFLVAAYDNPHNICEYARGQNLPFTTLQEPEDINNCPLLPTNFAIQPYGADVINEEKIKNYPTYPTVRYTPDQWRRYRNAYYRLVEHVDAEIGKLLTALETSKQLDNTLIIFTSDHGDGNGAHQWNQKSALYEEVINIPFILKMTRGEKANTTSTTLINNGIDLMPTLCQIAEIPTPAYCKGISILSLISNKSEHPYIVTETQFDKSVTKGWAVRSPRYKYVLYDKGFNREQLYDMENDRGEMINLALSNSYQKELLQHRQYLREWAANQGVKISPNAQPRP